MPGNAWACQCRMRLQKQDSRTNEYNDIEAYPDELSTAVPLQKVKSLCSALSLDLVELLGLTCCYCKPEMDTNDFEQRPHNELIKQRRKALNLSKKELGDKIGFHEEAIVDMEADENFLEGWPVNVITELSETLNIPSQILLKAKCNSCI